MRINNLIYCFCLTDILERWRENQTDLIAREAIKRSLDIFHLAISQAKKWGFKVEVITDLDTSKYLAEFPISEINLCLEFTKGISNSATLAKMLGISNQKEPFVYMDWNIIITDESFVEEIRGCKKDFLATAEYVIPVDSNYESNTQVVYSDLNNSGWLMTMSDHFVEEFVNKREFAYDCRIIGFNNLNFRDAYISEFLKCLNATRDKIDCSLVIEEYLLYCVSKSCNASGQTLIQKIGKKHEILVPRNFSGFTVLDIYDKNFLGSIDRINGKRLTKRKSATGTLSNIMNGVKISLCIVVMNRREHLMKTLKPNLLAVEKFSGSVDINILNYNSKDGLEAELFAQDWFIDALKRDVIKYYGNYNAEIYHATLPKNIVHFLAHGDYLLNVDADNFIGEGYLSYCLALIQSHKKIYFRSSGYSANGAYGRIGIHRQDFREIGGYNLKMVNWGFEDTEITLRLKKIGIQQELIPSHLCQDVIEHENDIRKLSLNNKVFDDDLRNSEYENVQKEFELYPNSDIKIKIDVFRVNHRKEQIKINEPSTHFSNK